MRKLICRVLHEALQETSTPHYTARPTSFLSKRPAEHLTISNALNQRLPLHRFSTVVYAKFLMDNEKQYMYFDAAKALREANKA